MNTTQDTEEASSLPQGIHAENLPKHIAIIMDGNGRWAEARKLPRIQGHKSGVSALRQIIKTCTECQIEYLSVFAFSTENWKRPKTEVSFLLNLLNIMIKQELSNLKNQNIRVKIIGDISQLSKSLQKQIAEIEEKTAHCTRMQFNIMINYGSRHEIISAVRSLVKKEPALSPEDIDESLFEKHLFTAGIPDPELLIRTSGEKRISNFLLWQISYSELYFHDNYWPDFSPENLIDIIKDYQSRNRRFGSL